MRIWPIALGVVVVLTCLGIPALVGLFLAFDAAGKTQPVTEADRALLVTTDELATRVESFKAQPGVEKVTKKRGLDSATELEYEYKPSDGTLYLTSAVLTEPTTSSASINYSSLKVGHGLGFSLSEEKTKMEERDDLFAWGDESHHALITHGGKPVGNLFAARKGRHIYSFMVIGVYFDSTETLSDLLLPKLERLTTAP
jgi:hypothetical protein